MTKESWILQAKKLKEEARKQPEKMNLVKGMQPEVR